MIDAYNALGHSVFQALAQTAGNVVISPLSIGITLAMGFAAAAGETAAEMKRVLRFKAAPPDLYQANAELLRRYAQGSAQGAPSLHLANALVLLQHGEAVTKSYKDLLKDSFEAEIFQSDITRISQWVAEKTDGKIEGFLTKLPQDDIAVLLSAIYFKAPWAQPFNPASTYDGRFSAQTRRGHRQDDGG